jgi:hypothetical protein
MVSTVLGIFSVENKRQYDTLVWCRTLRDVSLKIVNVETAKVFNLDSLTSRIKKCTDLDTKIFKFF